MQIRFLTESASKNLSFRARINDDLDADIHFVSPERSLKSIFYAFLSPFPVPNSPATVRRIRT